MSRGLNKDQLAELEMLRENAGGDLVPQAVLDFARSANTALHSAFTWDQDDAAESWRLYQAKQVIRAAVTMLPSPAGNLVPVRAYVFDARKSSYTLTAAVVADDEAAEAMLRQMRLDVERAVSRYRRFGKLVPHIEAALRALHGDAPSA